MRIKDLKLSSKLIYPTIILVVIILILVTLITQFLVEQRIRISASTDSEKLQHLVHGDIERIANKALILASALAEESAVKEAYQLADNQRIRQQLRTNLEKQLNGVRRNTGIGDQLRVHFHQAPARSVWRIWRDQGQGDGGDDLSGFRNSILEAHQTHQPVTGVELGKGGLVIRGISPIYLGNEYVGSVENFYGLDELLNKLTIGSNQFISVFLNEQAAELAWRLKDNEKVGNYTFVAQSADLSIDSYKSEYIRKGEQAPFFVVDGDNAITTFPVKDFAGNNVGVYYYMLNVQDIRHAEAQKLNVVRVMFILAFVVIILIIIAIVRIFVHKPLSTITDALNQLARGDFSNRVEMDQNDEFGQMAQNLNTTISRIARVIASVQKITTTVNEASGELSQTAQSMSSGANQQASSVEEISSSMEEMTSIVNQSSENAEMTNKMAAGVANDMQITTKSINETVGAVKRISDNITIIDDIAQTTNLLALNASVEAARAGAAGRGFAVVAAEVKKLAESTQQSASDIIKDSTETRQGAVKATEFLNKLMPEIRKTAELMKEISAANNEQKSGIDQINNAIQQLNEISQQNAASSEQLASNAESMKESMKQLKKEVSFFQF